MSRNRRNKKSTFFQSFWREAGRNTGKWASNKIFGPTGWATPRRHIIDRDSGSTNPRPGKNLVGQGNTSNSYTLDFEKEIKTKIRAISQQKFPKTGKALLNFLFEFEILLKGNKWTYIGLLASNEKKLRNRYADALFMKYKQGLELMKNSKTDEKAIQRIQRRIRVFGFYRFIRVFGFKLILFALLIVTIFLIVTKN